MPLRHGLGGDRARLLAELEAGFLYPPRDYKKPDVHEGHRRYAIVVVDMLEDFVFGKLKCERIVPKIKNIAAVLETARDSGIPVVYCNDSHKRSDFEMHRWEEHAMRGTKGAKVIDALTPRAPDFVVPKSTYSSFHNTELDAVLRSLYDGRSANTIAIAGVTTDCCVRHTTADAFFRRYEVEIIEDCVDAFTDAQHKLALQYMRYWYLCDVTTSKDLTSRLKGH